MTGEETQLIDEDMMERASVAPPRPEELADPDASTNPEARAFTGHPDHPPSSPDQPIAGNQDLLRDGKDPSEADLDEAEGQPS